LYLPLYLVVNLLVTFVVPSYRVYRRTGIHPVTFGKTDNAHDYIGKMMKIVTGLLVAVVLCFSFIKAAYQYTVPIRYLQREWSQMTGLLLMHISLVWIVVAQYQMSNSWRIGIDETNKTELVTSGVFSLSRNPIFLGMILSVAGMFLVIPNSLTLLLTMTSYILIQIQIRLEEAFLTKEHGEVYKVYRTKVHRLL
jgi:protein-S-isoprenylcysteine O-methyltransferase Ste14